MTPVTFSPVTMRPREYVTYNGYVPYNSSFDLSGAAIAGIVIGSLIVFNLLLWCCVRRCSSSRSTTTGETYVKAAPVVFQPVQYAKTSITPAMTPVVMQHGSYAPLSVQGHLVGNHGPITYPEGVYPSAPPLV